jgi:hypothetical protein
MMNPRFLPQRGRHLSVFLRYKFQPIQIPALSRDQSYAFSQLLICVDTSAIGICQPGGIRRVLKDDSQNSRIHHFRHAPGQSAGRISRQDFPRWLRVISQLIVVSSVLRKQYKWHYMFVVGADFYFEHAGYLHTDGMTWLGAL